jgi:hypothetical protein
MLGAMVGVLLLGSFMLSQRDAARRQLETAATAKATGLAATGAAATGASLQGAALMRVQRALYLADEDHGVLRVIPLSQDGQLTPRTKHQERALPGRPAALVADGDRVWVSIRQPGMLLELDRQLREVARVALPDDAWGLSVAGGLALVSSASTAQLSAIDLRTMKLRWSVPVAREPRGIAIVGDRAYVSHLVGAELTRVDDIAGAPRVSRINISARWMAGEPAPTVVID